MKITGLTLKLNAQKPLTVMKRVTKNGETEHYVLSDNGKRVCLFDFTDYKAIDGFYSHGEVKNFEVLPSYRRKPLGAKALLQAKDIITQTAKDKKIKFVKFHIPRKLFGNPYKLVMHMGAKEFIMADWDFRHFIYFIDKKASEIIQKYIKKEIHFPIRNKKNILSFATIK